MSDFNNEPNLIEALRSKTEKSDMNIYLKSTLGGYTKKSVLEYLNVMRRQQQATADTFSHNQQTLFEEKENLKKENELLKTRLSQSESEYRTLSASLRAAHVVESPDITTSDIVALKSNIAALEEDLNKSGVENSRLESLLDQKITIIGGYVEKLEQAEQASVALKEVIRTEMLETKTQRNTIARLNGSIEEKDEEIRFLTSLVSTGQVANLNGKINELMQQIIAQTEAMASCNNQNIAKSQTIESLSQEINTLRENLANLTHTLDSIHDQNEKLVAANLALADQLDTEYKRSIAQIKEKSGISIDILTTVRKLDEANTKIRILELQLQKQKVSEETDSVFESANQTEKIKSDPY